MIKKEHRLRKNKHFQYIYRKGQTKQSGAMSVVYVRTHIQPFKVGFSVTKKVGKSVVRSRVKRLMTEAFNQIYNTQENGNCEGVGNKSGGLNKNFNFIFVAKPSIVGLPLESVKKEMKICLKKANLINE